MTRSAMHDCCGHKSRLKKDFNFLRLLYGTNDGTVVFFFRKFLEYCFIFIFGGAVYIGIEMLYRGYSHWTMGFLGGLCLILVGLQNELKCMGKVGIIPQMAIGAVIITVLEFIAGVILNLWLHLDIWDYSNVPLNILGQVCLPFMFFWFLLAGVAIFVDDWIRVWLFEEDKPHYDLIWCHHDL